VKLALGTVQFGMNYGIQGNEQPDEEQAMNILNAAYAYGIQTFDTSSVYGSAEDILHSFLHQPHVNKESVHIISKFYGEIEQIEQGIESSLNRLGLDGLDGYLLHEADHVFQPNIIKHLAELKEKRLTKKIGVSVYTPVQALKALEYKEIDIIQVPYNIFDRRLDHFGFFQKAKKDGVTVFARSILLQGLLTMKIDQLPRHLMAAKHYLKDFENLCKEAHISQLEAAIHFVNAHDGIDYGIFGVDNLQQLTQILEILNKKRNNVLNHQLYDRFTNVEEKVINPTLWGTTKKGDE